MIKSTHYKNFIACFFSSRRRHTRSLRDWSSDVCSSDLGIGIVVPAGDGAPTIASIEDFKDALLAARVVVYANPAGGGAAGRSGERRVGKERRCRRSPYT